MIRVSAAAKINLNLVVTGRRADGYHQLDSFVLFTALADILHISLADQDSLEVCGPFAAALDDNENLVWKALALLRKASGQRFGLAVRLDKQIPVAAGLGGGSADAAAALEAVNSLLEKPLEPEQLAGIGLQTGADVPLCMMARNLDAVRMQGIGERLTPLPVLPDLGIILVNPGIRLSTAAVFGAVTADDMQPQAALQQPQQLASHEAIKQAISIGNGLLRPARGLAPPLDHILDRLAGLASMAGFIGHGMSGSGATCFALFASVAEARQAADAVALDCWVWSGGLSGNGALPPQR